MATTQTNQNKNIRNIQSRGTTQNQNKYQAQNTNNRKKISNVGISEKQNEIISVLKITTIAINETNDFQENIEQKRQENKKKKKKKEGNSIGKKR